MISRKIKNMIIFKCDICHEEKKTNFLRAQKFPIVLVWDICDGCLPKLREFLGVGREVRLDKK